MSHSPSGTTGATAHDATYRIRYQTVGGVWSVLLVCLKAVMAFETAMLHARAGLSGISYPTQNPTPLPLSNFDRSLPVRGHTTNLYAHRFLSLEPANNINEDDDNNDNVRLAP